MLEYFFIIKSMIAMKTVFNELDNKFWKPFIKWIRKYTGSDDDSDPYGNNPYVIL